MPNKYNVTGNENIMGDETSPLQMRPKLGQVVAFFKYRSTKMVNIALDSPGIPFWQRNYYEHIIRNDQDHRIIREYILSNPLNWEKDDENR